MVKIYSKTGDRGTTSLFGGQRVEKSSIQIEAYGMVDELNSLVGTILSENPPTDISRKLSRVQGELFVLGADLATPLESGSRSKSQRVRVPRIKKSFITRLEKEIDQWEKRLPKLKNFIFPGGSKVGAKLHLARAIARRTERSVVNLSTKERTSPSAQIYINRVSDWFFVAARYVNKLEKTKETIWKGRG